MHSLVSSLTNRYFAERFGLEMSISVYTGSELNRLARKFIDEINKELRPKGQKASFADWQLIVDGANKNLEVRYVLYQMHLDDKGRLTRYVNGVRRPLSKLEVKFGSVGLS